MPDVEYIPYGPPDGTTPACELVATFGDIESEYAAFRKGAGLLDCPHRGTLRIVGADRRDFLNRLLTQELKDLEPGTVRPSFWLNRPGRIEADLLLIELGDQLLVDVDIHQAARTVSTLGEFLFSEDVEMTDASDRFHRLLVCGPAAFQAVAAAAGTELDLDQGRARPVTVAGVATFAARQDQTGDAGVLLIVPLDGVAAVWEALVATDETVGGGRHRVRPTGWFAFNTARIEAGTPLFNVDFGPTNLPHETGVLNDRVSFSKGCYLGQEIVARTENLGRPKQMLVGLRMSRDLLPVAGAQVFAAPAADDDADRGVTMDSPIGVVTSSTLSPMLGRAPVAFAMIRTAHAGSGTTVLVNAEGAQATAVVGPLRFYPPPNAKETPT